MPPGPGASDHRVNASAECLMVWGEVTGFALDRPGLMRWHQLSVDAYGAQHGGGGVPPIRLAFSLVGLHLALDLGHDGNQVRAAHSRMGKPDRTWPIFSLPVTVGPMTIMDVAEEGILHDSPAGHATAVRRWAQTVWSAWADQHGSVVALTCRLLPETGA